MSLPDLIVFDLDFTLWNCGGTYCDCLTPPFHKDGERVVDATGRHVRLYPDVEDILEECERMGIRMGLASRTEEPQWARTLVDLLGITDRFAGVEIYPGSKLKHFSALQTTHDILFSQMLFFDDEMRNIREVGQLGVTTVFVSGGLDEALFREGLSRFAGPAS
ncbi:MAG: magnesium-dependent phosphatase-1 [Planctomycetaceae bacterium]|nr:magnesium-dependent phosphatase-1 [Planctomycetaceae bacterium]